ncbi:MAG: DinB family protein, partial [Dehalococcoidia bacterium]
MTALDQIRALYDYNEWATGHVIDAAAGLNEEELARELGASFGSVQGNLSHIAHAQSIWLSRWTEERLVEPPKPESGRAIAALRESFRGSHDGLRRFVETLDDDRLAQQFSYVDTQSNAQQRVL